MKYEDEWHAVTGDYKAAVREADAERNAAAAPRPPPLVGPRPDVTMDQFPCALVVSRCDALRCSHAWCLSHADLVPADFRCDQSGV